MELDADRYDGLGDWYDVVAAPSRDLNVPDILRLVGRGSGLCVDLGCGTGLYTEALRSTGHRVIGFDLSADQLRVAANRGATVFQARMERLPLPDSCAILVTALWVSTDVDDIAAVALEAARVLAPGGRLVLFGTHPCFNGPAVESRPDGARIVHPVYRRAGWHTDAPWWGRDGIRSRVGVRHVPLAGLINAVLASGLRLIEVCEPRDDPIPAALALVAIRE